MDQEHQKIADVSADEVELGNVEDNLVPTKNDDGKCRDLPFAIAYYISIAFSFIFGIYLITQIKNSDDENGNLSFKFNFVQIFVGVMTGIAFTFIWLAIIVKFAGCIIKASLILTPSLLVIAAIVSLLTSPLVGIILLIMAALLAWYAYSVWNRIPFAVACLHIVIAVFKSFYSPLLINVFMGMVSIVLLIIDMLVFVGVANGISSSGAQIFVFFLLFFLIYWHNIVSINVAHVTACGVMGTWFYTDLVDGVTRNSFKRAVTTSFGTICFGSLIEAVIRALSAIVRYLQNNNRDNAVVYALLCVLRCILDCIGDIVEYINSYAFVFVALYGDGYLQSAKKCFNMFKSRGIEALINDDLTTIPLWLGAVFNLCIVILVCIAIDGLNGNVLIAVLFGIVIYLCCVYTLISYIKTLFVCWMNDPDTFSKHRPQEFNEIVQAANRFGYNTTWCQPQNDEENNMKNEQRFNANV